MKKSDIRLLAMETLRELAKDDREPARMLVIPHGVRGWKGRAPLFGKVKNLRNLFHADKLPVEEVAEGAYALLRDAGPKNDAGIGRKNHLKISGESWNQLLQLSKGDIAAFLDQLQNRRLHRFHAQAA